MSHEAGEARAPEPRVDPPRPAPAVATPVAAPQQAGPTAFVLQLQRTIGNTRTTQILREPTATGDRKTTRYDVGGAAETIAEYFINAKTAPKREELLTTLLVNHDRAKELRATYKSNWSRDLDADLGSLGDADALRALDSLDYGELRPMSKVLIALGGTGTDTTTLWRVLKECNKAAPAGTGIARFDAMWSAVTGSLPSGCFDSFKSQGLAAALDDDLDGYELVKAHATLAYGDLRGIDKVYIAMVQAGTDEALLFEGLARCNPNTIEADFRDYEFRKLAFSDNASSIWDALDSELSGEDYRRALALLDREPNPEYGTFSVGKEKTRRLGGNQRLVALVKAAVHGAGTNVELIMTSIDEATQAERDELKKQVEDATDPLGLRGTFGDLSSGELARLRAKLGIKETPGDAAGHVTAAQLNDPTTQILRGLGGTDVGNVFETIKMSAGATWARFKTEYEKRATFNDYVWQNTASSEKAYLQTTIFNTDLDTRLHWCFGAVSDDEDYLFHLLGNFAGNADKRRLAGDEKWMDRLPGRTCRAPRWGASSRCSSPRTCRRRRTRSGSRRPCSARRAASSSFSARPAPRSRTRTGSCRRARRSPGSTRTSRRRSASCSRGAARAPRARSRTTPRRATSSPTPRR